MWYHRFYFAEIIYYYSSAKCGNSCHLHSFMLLPIQSVEIVCRTRFIDFVIILWTLVLDSLTCGFAFSAIPSEKVHKLALGLRTLCSIFLTLFYSEFLTTSTTVLLVISIMLAFFNNHAPEIFPCKFSHSRMKQMQENVHDTTKHKVGMLKLVTVYAVKGFWWLLYCCHFWVGYSGYHHHKFTTTCAVNSFP